MTKYFLSPRSGTITIRPDFCVLFKKMKCVSNHVELHDLSSLYSHKVPTFFLRLVLSKRDIIHQNKNKQVWFFDLSPS